VKLLPKLTFWIMVWNEAGVVDKQCTLHNWKIPKSSTNECTFCWHDTFNCWEVITVKESLCNLI